MPLRYTILMLILSCALVAPSPRFTQATPRPDDATITNWVRQALQEDLRLDPSDVTINTHEGIVTLSGDVRTLAGKQYAELEAQKITGVIGVLNELQVIPSSLYDADIAQNVRRRLGNSASLTASTSSGLAVTVLDAVVTLSGTVNSYAESQEATLLASEVRGVKGVLDHLTVTYPTTRPDAEIQQDVTTALSNDVYLSSLPIGITVTKGVVTLSGRVASAYQRHRAVTSARLVWNVIAVNNQLTVDAAVERGAQPQGPQRTEAQITAAIQAGIAADQRLQPKEISVQVHAGEVTLLGTIPSYYQQRIAAEDARNVVGVTQVLDQMAVRTVPRADPALQDDVQFQLNADAILGTDTITARVRNGIVTLTGVVHNNPARDHATEVTARVVGVRKVVNQLTVNWGDDDMALQRRIETRLLANAETAWVAKKIHVTVNQGAVTLSGQVNLWSERDAASRVAFQTYEVQSVDNQLVVTSSEAGR